MIASEAAVALVHTPSSYLTHVNRLFEVQACDIDHVYDLGARYDAAERSWFIPEGVDAAPFAPWLSSLRASCYGVVLAKIWCVHCANLTRVAGILLPRDHDSLEQRGGVQREWIGNANRFVPTFIDVLSPAVLSRIRGFAPKYDRVRDENWGEIYQNHCEHCGALHTDRKLYRDVEGALDYRLIGSTAIELHAINEPFLGRGGDGIDADQLETNPDLQIRKARRRVLRAGVQTFKESRP